MKHQATVTQGAWGVSTETGTGIKGAILHVYQFPLGEHMSKPMRRGDGYGLHFETKEAADAYALEHGYTQPYYSRVWCVEHRVLHTFMGRPTPTFGKCFHRS